MGPRPGSVRRPRGRRPKALDPIHGAGALRLSSLPGGPAHLPGYGHGHLRGEGRGDFAAPEVPLRALGGGEGEDHVLRDADDVDLQLQEARQQQPVDGALSPSLTTSCDLQLACTLATGYAVGRLLEAWCLRLTTQHALRR